ncbi:hypothetical protein [Rhodohalobacter sp.]
MSKLTGYRILAFGLYYLIILYYAVVLFGLTTLMDIGELSPEQDKLLDF